MSFFLRALLLCCLLLYGHHAEALFSFHTKHHRFAKRTLQAQRKCYQRTTQTTTNGSGTSSAEDQHGSIAPDPTTANITGHLTSPTPEEYTSIHNKYRALHGAQNLIWNDTLSAKAQQWAKRCVFQHSHGTLGPFGGQLFLAIFYERSPSACNFSLIFPENLAAGTGSDYDFSSAFKSWTDNEEGKS
jgi:uncharacterized protein YkwD